MNSNLKFGAVAIMGLTIGFLIGRGSKSPSNFVSEIQSTPAAQTSDDTKISITYECPEDYPTILARLVYAKFKDDPFVFDPDNPPEGIYIDFWLHDSIRDLGFTFMPEETINYIPWSQKLIVHAEAKTHEALMKFHENLGIRISNATKEAYTEQSATHPDSKAEGGEKPQSEAAGGSR